jgi:hypothetical protein
MSRLRILLLTAIMACPAIANAQAAPPTGAPPPPPPVVAPAPPPVAPAPTVDWTTPAPAPAPTVPPPVPAPVPAPEAAPPPPAPAPAPAPEDTWAPRGYGTPRAPQAPQTAFDRSGEIGIEVSVGGGFQSGGGSSPVQAPSLYAGAPDNAAGTLLNPAGGAAIGQGFTPYAFDPFNFEARVGYRFHKNWSVGGFFSYANYLVNDGADSGDAPDFTSQLAREQLTVGVYGRYYVTQIHRRLQPWVELGVGFNFDAASYTRPIGQATNGQAETGNFNLSQYGIIVPLKVGLDWRLAPAFSVGPMIGYSRVFPLTGCVEIDVDQFSPVPGTNTCSSPPVTNSGYNDFFGGIFVKLTYNPWAR